MDESYKVSIIIPCHNSGRTLERCVNSVLLQSYHNIEVICIDDGSEDNTVEVLESYSEKDDRVHIRCNDRWRGTMSTRIKGLMCVTGDYVCFIDSDDYVEKNYVEMLLSSIMVSDADISFSDSYQIDGEDIKKMDTLFEGVIFYNEYKMRFAESGGSVIQWYVLWGKMFRVEILKETLPKLQRYCGMNMCEDLVISSYVSKNVKSATYTKETSYNYCINKTDGMTSSPTTYGVNLEYISNVSNALEVTGKQLSLCRDAKERWIKWYRYIWNKRIDMTQMNRFAKLILKFKIKFMIKM